MPPPVDTSLAVWPENWSALCVFLRMQTQWQVGMSGPIGLRYDTLAFCLELEQVPRSNWPAVVDGVQAMELESLRLVRDRNASR